VKGSKKYASTKETKTLDNFVEVYSLPKWKVFTVD